MLLAKVACPDTARLEEPAAFVMLLPEAIVKVAIVCADCKSQTAEFVITTSVDEDKLPVNLRVPAFILVSPV